MSESPTYLHAVEVLELFGTGELSPVAYLDALIDTVEGSEEGLSLVAERLFDEARSQARVAEKRYLRDEARPLEGLPVAVKEEQPMIGRSWTEGSVHLRDRVAALTHPAVERIEAAGGIVHIRTTVPEFCAAGFTHSELWGISRNPWRPSATPGGSSGGSGGALAAGYAPLATGSDIAGSIRIPASFNGIVGYKPPHGRVPGLAPFNLDTYCVDGPMARTTADCALLLNVMAGQHPADHVSLPFPDRIGAARGLEGRRLAVCVTLGDYAVDDEIAAAIRAAGDYFRSAGAEVEEIELPWRHEEITMAAMAHYGTIFSSYIREDLGADGAATVLPYTRDLMERADAAAQRLGVIGSVECEAAVQADLAHVFGRFDQLLCPTLGTTHLDAGDDYVDTPVEIAGQALSHHLEAPLTIPFNMAGRCPVLSVPVGITSVGVPVGMQIVGRPFDDQGVFDVGAVAELMHPWYRNEEWRPRDVLEEIG